MRFAICLAGRWDDDILEACVCVENLSLNRVFCVCPMVSMSSDFSILSDNDDLPIGWDKVELDKLLTQTENIIPADYEDELF